MIQNHRWIHTGDQLPVGKCPVFYKKFSVGEIVQASLAITAKGVYRAVLNGEKIGSFVLAPGFTQFSDRLQYQTYDVTATVKKGENELFVTVAPGWYWSRIRAGWRKTYPTYLIAELELTYADGKKETIATDNTWTWGFGETQFSEIYDGEVYDATKIPDCKEPAVIDEFGKTDELIPQEADEVRERERFKPKAIFKTPKGETVIDFGQNLAGYPALHITAKKGERVTLSFAEILDKDGNFYNENYRSAKSQYIYTCRDGEQMYAPWSTFFGYRYVRVDEFPASATLTKDTFTSVAVYSDMEQTGELRSSNEKLNQLISNIFWSQRSNFVDVPSDCPQRDERQGWTGDAQFFCKTACYNFNTFLFYRKWFRDMAAYQKRYGYVGFVIPCGEYYSSVAAAWADAVVIAPWRVYQVFGNKELLEETLPMMISHVQLIENNSEEKDTWRGWKDRAHFRQFGDWLASDSADVDSSASFIHDSFSGATDPNFIQAVFFAYDVTIVALALETLGKDSSYYRDLFERIKTRFQKDFPVYKTQTECVLALRFNLTPNREQTIKQLVELIHKNGDHLSTGLVGTPHILHALSENGEVELAYSLLLQETFPSWLYSVNLGATTIWEHWDGINEKGELWSKDMNSLNHYSLGAVGEWMYEVAVGINQEKDTGGFEKIVVAPHPNKRLGFMEGSLKTAKGKIYSKWSYGKDGVITYEIEVPDQAKIIIGEKEYYVEKGKHVFYQ